MPRSALPPSSRIPAGALIDLGGIAKGWIADLCRGPLADATDDASVLLDAGGELPVRAPWRRRGGAGTGG